MEKLQLKSANKKGLSFIKTILQENYLVYEDIENNNIKLFLAYKNSECVGIIGLEKIANLGLLRSLVVLDKYRNKGYGREICNKLLAYAKDKKIDEIYLLTVSAKNFFKKLGFNVVKRENAPDEIKNTGEFSSLCPDTAVCMQVNPKIFE